MEQIITSIAPIFIIMLFGTIMRATSVAKPDWVTVLNKFGLYIAFPAVILHSLINAKIEQALDLTSLGLNTLLLLGIIFVTLLVCALGKVEKKLRNTYMICIFFGNIGYLGYPFISSLITGSEGVISLHISIYNIILFTIGLFILEHSMGHHTCKKVILKKIATNPLLLSVFAGLLMLFLKIKPPLVINKTIEMLYKSASPVVLFALGIFLIRKVHWKKEIFHTLLLSSLRLAVVPAVFIAAYFLFSPGANFKVSILEAAMPLAITPFALAEQYPMEKDIIATSIMLSTILSVVTLSLVWAIIR